MQFTGGKTTDDGLAQQDRRGNMSAADKRKLDQFGTDSGWVGVAGSFAASWSDFGGATALVGYKRDALGWVCLKGTAKKGIALAYPDTIFTLPVGLRPALNHYFAVPSNALFAGVVVNPNGTVQLYTGGSNSDVELDAIRFDPAT